MYYEHPSIRNGSYAGGLKIDKEGKLRDENGAQADITDPAMQASLDQFGFTLCAGPKESKKKSGGKTEGKKDEGNGDKKDEGSGEDTPASKKAATKKASKKSKKKK